MSFLLWCKELTLLLLVGVSCNAFNDCKEIPICDMMCFPGGPSYECESRGITEVPSFPESAYMLYLSDNAINTIYIDTFADYLNVILIDLSKNSLTSVPEAAFKTNVVMTSLHLSSNFLSSLPVAVFMSNIALKVLGLANNNLTSVPGDVFKNITALTYLTLSFNLFTNLSENLFTYNKQLGDVYLTGNPIDIIETHVFDNNNNIKDLKVDCSYCFDCDRLSIPTCKWITKRVTDLRSYSFTCRNGATLPNTVDNCSDDESRLAVTRIQMKSSSLEFTTDIHPAMKSTIDKVQHTTMKKDSSFTSIALIIGGIAASFTLITAFIVLRKFIDTTSRIKHSDLSDTEHNSTINDGIDFIKTINCDGQMDKKYNNIPPESHIHSIYNGIDVSNKLTCNKQMAKEGYNNIPPECHMDTLYNVINVSNKLTCNKQIVKEG